MDEKMSSAADYGLNFGGKCCQFLGESLGMDGREEMGGTETETERMELTFQFEKVDFIEKN